MMLGNAGHLLIGSNVYEDSLGYLNKLYTKKENGITPSGNKFTVFDEGRQYIVVNESKDTNYSGFLYFKEELEDIAIKLKENGVKINETKNIDELIEFQSPEGVHVKIMKMNHEGTPNPMKSESKVDFGKFGEYAIKTDDMDKSCEYWQNLGFNLTYRNDEWKFAILCDDIFIVGLHGHDMDNNALTYFDPKMPEKVNDLKERGIKMRTEKKYKIKENDAVDATAISPDGQVFYFFTGNV